MGESDGSVGYAYSDRTMRRSVPKFSLPDKPLSANITRTLIADEMALDGKPLQNLASFVTTWMERDAEELMSDSNHKNFIDMDEYPQTHEVSKRCVNMIARLWHAPLGPTEDATGTATIGSTEAILTAVLAMKFRWRARRKEQGKDYDKPNIVCGSNVHISWKKATRYFDVEARFADVSPDCLVLTPERAKPLIDENTIGVCPILGSTYDGTFEDVEGIHSMLEELNAEKGWEVPMHVDAASGGFIAPFTNPELRWDFRLPLVKSINASGHKFGLVYAGIGWLCFRDKADLPEELVFHVNYLSGDQAHFTLNFTRNASNIVGQYYNFLRLGRKGYTEVMANAMENAAYLRQTLEETGRVTIVDSGDMPLVAFTLKDGDSLPYTLFEIQDKLRTCGWIVPAYTGPPGAKSITIARVVCKENFSHDLAEQLVGDFKKAIDYLEKDHHETRTLLQKAVASSYEEEGPADISAEDTMRGLPQHLKKDLHARGKRSRNLRHANHHRRSGNTTHGVC